MDLKELLNLNGRKSIQNDDHLKIIHQIKLNLSSDHPSSQYYYKRWIWMNFPWICQHKPGKSFQEFISFFEAQETRIGSVFMQCLSIVYLNKLKKDNVFSNKPRLRQIQSKGSFNRISQMSLHQSAL